MNGEIGALLEPAQVWPKSGPRQVPVLLRLISGLNRDKSRFCWDYLVVNTNQPCPNCSLVHFHKHLSVQTSKAQWQHNVRRTKSLSAPRCPLRESPTQLVSQAAHSEVLEMSKSMRNDQMLLIVFFLRQTNMELCHRFDSCAAKRVMMNQSM